MTEGRNPTLIFLFQTVFFFFIFSLFLSLNSDSSSQFHLRAAAGWLSVGIFFVFLSSPKAIFKIRSFSFLFLTFFVLFETIRAVWGFIGLSLYGSESASSAVLERYLSSVPLWFLYYAVFGVSYLYFVRERPVRYLTRLVAFGGFFLATNAFPGLVQKGSLYYLSQGGRWVFFFPFFYEIHPWINQYLIGHFAQVNYMGDLMAMGFFPALGLSIYSFFSLRDHWRKRHDSAGIGRSEIVQNGLSLLMYLMLALMIAVVVLLLFSRGSIVCFFAALIFFLAAYVIKFHSPVQIGIIALLMGLLFGFLVWTGNFERAFKEVQTLQQEIEWKGEKGSLSTNVEGAKRAWRIYQAHPVWGVGTNGYAVVSEEFATEGTLQGKSYYLEKFQALCHYLHLLAEEGAGAFFYFLFILGYFVEVSAGLLRVRSRFQYLIALSFSASVLMVLAHAAFNHLMQRFSMPMLVYLAMGASFAVLRKDFERLPNG